MHGTTLIEQPVLITRFAALQELADQLLRETIVAVDTESNSLHAYRERVCLVQFSTLQQDYLVDPLALQDLSPLGPLFAAPHIEKVFHAAEYDVMCLKRDFGFEFVNLFDTMTAARILGIKEVGLGSLLFHEFGVTLDKRYQRANWGMRPLPPDLIEYARQDTHYLISLRERIYSLLDSKNLLPLAYEDFGRLCCIDGRYDSAETDACWHMNGAYELEPQQLAVLQALCDYRDQMAYDLDRPLFKVIGDHTLVAIARVCPGTVYDLRRVPGMTDGQLHRHGRGLLMAVQRGLQSPPVKAPRPPRPDARFLARLEALREWRKNTARQWGVESDVILPRDLMLQVAEQAPHSPEALASVLGCSPWRMEQFGAHILRVIDKNHKS